MKGSHATVCQCAAHMITCYSRGFGLSVIPRCPQRRREALGARAVGHGRRYAAGALWRHGASGGCEQMNAKEGAKHLLVKHCRLEA